MNPIRLFLFAILALFALSAQAQTTITLGPIGCGLNRQCIDIPNDDGATISLYSMPFNTIPPQYLFIDSKPYKGVNVSPGVLYAEDGSWLTLTTFWTSYRTCNISGRGQHCSTHWGLTGGSVVLP